MSEKLCPDCKEPIAEGAMPYHQLGHRVKEDLATLGKSFAEEIGKVKGEVVQAVKDIKFPEPQDLQEALAPLVRLERLSKLDELTSPSLTYDDIDPEDLVAHAKDCPTCKGRWGPYLKGIGTPKEEVKVEVVPLPVPIPPPVLPPKPKALSWPRESEVPGSALSMAAHGVKRVKSQEGIKLAVKAEEDGKKALAAGVVPSCQWVKDPEGEWYYACEEGKK